MNPADPQSISAFAEQYTAAWCSQNPASVAACYEKNGSLRVNNDDPAVGREAISKVAQGFMTAFPDMRVIMDDIHVQEDGLSITGPLQERILGREEQGARSILAVSKFGRSATTDLLQTLEDTLIMTSTFVNWSPRIALERRNAT